MLRENHNNNNKSMCVNYTTDVSGTVTSGDCVYFMCSLCVVHKTCLAVVMCSVPILVGNVCTLCVPCVLYTNMFSCCDVFGTVTGGDCMYFVCSLCVVHETCLAVVMCPVPLLAGIACTLCVPCVLYTKHV